MCLIVNELSLWLVSVGLSEQLRCLNRRRDDQVVICRILFAVSHLIHFFWVAVRHLVQIFRFGLNNLQFFPLDLVFFDLAAAEGADEILVLGLKVLHEIVVALCVELMVWEAR